MIKTALNQKPLSASAVDFSPIQRLTALWALSEAALGGVLHAFRVPFTGLVMGSVAVVLISMIAHFSDKKGVIIKATLIVLIAKGAVSPHTPVTAYAAVFLQGVLGETAFRLIKSPRWAALILGGSALLLSAVQKFLILTLVFGMTVWKSLDLFGNFVLQEFLSLNGAELWLPISTILILIYIALHMIAGIISGWYAPRLASAILFEYDANEIVIPDLTSTGGKWVAPPKRRRRWLRRLSAYLVIVLALTMVVLSYIIPVFEKNQGLSALIMVLRSLAVMGIWVYVLGPFFRKKLQRYLQGKQSLYADDVQSVLLLMPQLKALVSAAYRYSAEFSGFRRWKRFVFIVLLKILTMPVSAEKS